MTADLFFQKKSINLCLICFNFHAYPIRKFNLTIPSANEMVRLKCSYGFLGFFTKCITTETSSSSTRVIGKASFW
jgi:hypothetical protein